MSTLSLVPTATATSATLFPTAISSAITMATSSPAEEPFDGNPDSNDGASGRDTGFVQVSRGAEIAIIVVVVLVALFGRTSLL